MLQKHRPYNPRREYSTVKSCNKSTDRTIIQPNILQNSHATTGQTHNYTAEYFTIKPCYRVYNLHLNISSYSHLQIQRPFNLRPNILQLNHSTYPIIKHKTIIKLYLENRRHICAENLDKISIFVEILTRKIFPKNDRLT